MAVPRRTKLLLLILVMVSGVSGFLFRTWTKTPDACVVDGELDEACLLRERLHARRGANMYSQNEEELLVRDFFEDMREGVFLDVGAGPAKQWSTTFLLEEKLGWHGVAVDANEAFAPDYVTSRPKTKFFALYVNDQADASHAFFISRSAWALSAGSEAYVAPYGSYRRTTMPTTTLDVLLDHLGMRKVDFLSMDIEQGEPAALAGFDIERFGVELVCIEFQEDTQRPISAYMERHGYVPVPGYATMDRVNEYFAPRGSPRLAAAIARTLGPERREKRAEAR